MFWSFDMCHKFSHTDVHPVELQATNNCVLLVLMFYLALGVLHLLNHDVVSRHQGGHAKL